MASIRIPSSDENGAFDAYVAEPRDKPAGAVVLIQEIFGVNAVMRETADMIAGWGFIAVVPDLFWRLEPGIDLTDKTQAEWDRAFDLMKRFDQDRGVEDLQATLHVARRLPGGNGRAGVLGYCLGGRLAVMMAARSDADVSVSYYGVGLDGLIDELRNVQKPLVAHIADQDRFFPAEGRTRFIEAARDNPSIRTHLYAGVDHAFARPGGEHYAARAAAIANGRTAEALEAALS